MFKAVFAAAMLSAGCVNNAPRETLVGDYLSGRLAARLNAVDEAAQSFARAHGEAPHSIEILKDAFFFHLASGDVDRAAIYAIELVKREADGGGDDGLARIVLAARAIKVADYPRARTVLSEGISATYFIPLRTILKSWATDGVDGPDAALLTLSQTESGQFRGFNPLHEALLAENAGRLDQARAAHQLSFMTFGGPVGRAAHGAFLERSGDVEAAREYYSLLVQDAGPARRLALAGLARLERGVATNAYQNTTPVEGAAIAFYSLGAAFLEQAVNQKSAAESAGFHVGATNYNLPLILTQTALFLDPDLGDARRFAGSILNVYGDHEKAIEMLSLIDPASPYYEQAQIDMAGAFNALDRDDEAIALLREAARRDPASYEVRWMLANLFSSKGRDKDAVRVLDDLIKRLPEEPDRNAWRYFVSRAAAHIELDQWENAEPDLKRAVDIAPEEPTALNYLGYSWAERGENLDEAFDLIEKAVSLQPNSGAIIDSLGWAHYQLGDYAMAVGHLEQAAALEPGDPTITDHLGDVYWRLGRKIEARYQWRRALELAPPDDLEKELKLKLAKGLPENAE